MINTHTICITGASSGIGKGLALHYARANTILILSGRNQQRLEQTAAECKKLGALVKTKIIDVTHTIELNQWLIEQDQDTPIDLLIANAGCSCAQLRDTMDDENRITQTMIDTHLTGTINTLKPIINTMKQRQSGQIAIMSSINALIPLGNSALYGALKAALLHYGLALRAELLRHNISVSVICPGFVDSALTKKNTFYMPLKLSAAHAAQLIQKGLKKKKAIIAFPWVIRAAIRVFHCLPQVIKCHVASRL